jgi:DNA-dependent RNA polymerase auxiliary subunit epsilon
LLYSVDLENQGIKHLKNSLDDLYESEKGKLNGLIIVIENAKQFNHFNQLQKYINNYVGHKKIRTDNDNEFMKYKESNWYGKSIGFLVHQINVTGLENCVFYPNKNIGNTEKKNKKDKIPKKKEIVTLEETKSRKQQPSLAIKSERIVKNKVNNKYWNVAYIDNLDNSFYKYIFITKD